MTMIIIMVMPHGNDDHEDAVGDDCNDNNDDDDDGNVDDDDEKKKTERWHRENRKVCTVGFHLNQACGTIISKISAPGFTSTSKFLSITKFSLMVSLPDFFYRWCSVRVLL